MGMQHVEGAWASNSMPAACHSGNSGSAEVCYHHSLWQVVLSLALALGIGWLWLFWVGLQLFGLCSGVEGAVNAGCLVWYIFGSLL